MNSLIAESYLLASNVETDYIKLTPEGEKYYQQGFSPEIQFINAIPLDSKYEQPKLVAILGADLEKKAFGICMKKGWISKIDGSKEFKRVIPDPIMDECYQQLQSVQQNTATPDIIKALSTRKLVETGKKKSYKVTAGPAWNLVRRKIAAELTKEMLDNKEWETEKFKEYNFETAGKEVGGGHLHALMRVRTEFRQILLEMGFQEMPTNRYVESSFWNFDALFQPQSHPARDAHDTFFLSNPSTTLTLPEDYVERTRQMHETGGQGSGSLGYHYDWKRSEANKNLLRTHTTAVSARMLYKLANQPGGFQPAKYFSIDRVFRNEALDATHLAEFHQVEGVVADRNLSLGDLIGIITEFFRRIGITQLRFKPAYNPYTEPSMEIFGYHPDLKKWTEIGNSGIFRPEMLIPMGLPNDVRVIAWGLSLERPTMIKYRCKNIRELFGHKVKFDMSQTAPICRF